MSDPNKLARDYYDKLERDNILLREALERIATFDKGDGSTWRTIGDAPAIARDALLRAGKPEEHRHQWEDFADEPTKRECASCGVIEDKPAPETEEP